MASEAMMLMPHLPSFCAHFIRTPPSDVEPKQAFEVVDRIVLHGGNADLYAGRD